MKYLELENYYKTQKGRRRSKELNELYNINKQINNKKEKGKEGWKEGRKKRRNEERRTGINKTRQRNKWYRNLSCERMTCLFQNGNICFFGLVLVSPQHGAKVLKATR